MNALTEEPLLASIGRGMKPSPHGPDRGGGGGASTGARHRERSVLVQRGKNREGGRERQPLRRAQGRHRGGARPLQLARVAGALREELLRPGDRRPADPRQRAHPLEDVVTNDRTRVVVTPTLDG